MEGTSGFVGDLKGIILGKGDAMKRVATNSQYFVIALIIYAIVQAAQVLKTWMAFNKMGDNPYLGGIDFTAMYGPMQMLQGWVQGIILGLVFMALLYGIISAFYKGKKEFGMKGFMTLYCFMLAPMVLTVIPVVGFLAAIWVIVLYFLMMKRVFDYGFFAALVLIIVSAIVFAVIALVAAFVMGLMGVSLSFMDMTSDGFEFNMDGFDADYYEDFDMGSFEAEIEEMFGGLEDLELTE